MVCKYRVCVYLSFQCQLGEIFAYFLPYCTPPTVPGPWQTLTQSMLSEKWGKRKIKRQEAKEAEIAIYCKMEWLSAKWSDYGMLFWEQLWSCFASELPRAVTVHLQVPAHCAKWDRMTTDPEMSPLHLRDGLPGTMTSINTDRWVKNVSGVTESASWIRFADNHRLLWLWFSRRVSMLNYFLTGLNKSGMKN